MLGSEIKLTKSISTLLIFLLLAFQVIGSAPIHAAASTQPPVASDDAAVTREDTGVKIDVLANDRGNISSIYKVYTPLYGSVTINPDQTLTYIPKKDFNGQDTFMYTAAGNSYYSTATVTVTVQPLGDPPTAQNDSGVTSEDVAITIDVLANDYDVDGDHLSITEVSQGANGAVTLNSDRTVTFKPNANFNGTDTFTYKTTDGNGYATAMVTITVSPVNDAPAAAADSAATLEDAAVTIPVLANDIDIDGDKLTVSNVSKTVYGTTAVNPDNTITYTPGINFNGTEKFTYTVSDQSGGTSTAGVTVTVNPANDMPDAIADSAVTEEDIEVIIPVLVNDSDLDGDTLTVTGVTQAVYGSLSINPDYTVTYTPNPDYNGTDQFTYIVSDGNGGSTTTAVSIAVSSVNDLPVAGADIVSVDEDNSIDVSVLVNDTDVDGDMLTVITATTVTNGSLTVNPDNTINYQPNPNFNGIDKFTYTVSDGQGGTASAAVDITINPVNDLPDLMSDSFTTSEDQAVNMTVLANDSDIDGDTLTVSVVTQGSNGTVTVNPDSTVTYIPNANFFGTDKFTYTVSDGNGGIAAATVTVIVNPVNDLPVAAADSAITNEDTAVAIAVLANDSDIDGDKLIVTGMPLADNGSVSINVDGTITYSPNPNFYGTDQFTYTVSDGSGGTASTTVKVQVNPVNDVPIALDDSVATDEDTSLLVTVLSNDSDVDGDSLAVTGVTQAVCGSVKINTDNTIAYTPFSDFNGVDTFTYTIDDGKGGRATTTVTVLVNPVNDLPVIVMDSVFGDEDAVLKIPVLSNDIDVDGDKLMVTGVTQAVYGAAAVNDDGTITYKPDANFFGTDTFTYTASDGNGGTGTAAVNLTVYAVNDPPKAVEDNVITEEDSSITMSLLVNDTDVEGDVLTIATVTAAVHGMVTLNADNTVTYVPEADFYGTDSFIYTITDGNGGTTDAPVTITVNSVNDLPTAANDQAAANQDTAVNISVLTNDSDPDGDKLTVSSVNHPANGIVTINPDGTLTYTPNPDFNGTDSFTYTVNDGNEGSATASVTIMVIDNVPPVLSVTSPTDNLQVSTGSLTVAGTTEVGAITSVNGTAVDTDPTGSFSTTVNLVPGSNTITVAARDAAGNTATVTRIVEYIPVNQISNLILNPEPMRLGSSLSVKFELGTGSYVSVKVYNEAGQLIRTIWDNIYRQAYAYSLGWDGKNQNGVLVPDGYYKIVIEAKDAAGYKIGFAEKIFKAARMPVLSSITDSPDPFDPVTGQQAEIKYTVSCDALVTVRVIKDYTVVRTLISKQLQTGGMAQTVYWDGRDDDGNLLPDRTYTYQIEAVSPFEATFVKTYSSYTTVEKETPSINNFSATPDPLRLSQSYLSIKFDLSEDAYVTIKILDNSGTVIRILLDHVSKRSGLNGLSWDGKNDEGILVPEGTYTVSISAIDKYGKPSGELQTSFTAGYMPSVSSFSASPDIFNPEDQALSGTSISYTLSNDALVTVEVINGYDTVRILTPKALQPGGVAQSVCWDGRNDSGKVVGDADYTVLITAVSPTVESFTTIYRGTVTVEKGAPGITGVTLSQDPYRLGTTNLSIQYTLNENSTVYINVYRGDVLVKELVNGAAKLAGINGTGWDGRDSSGAPVPEGFYTITIKAVDRYGKFDQAQANVTSGYQPVLSSLSSSPEPFDYLVDADASVSFTLSNDARVTVSIIKGGTAVRTINAGVLAAGSQSIIWDGRDDTGIPVQDGPYTYQIEAVSPTVDTFKGISRGNLTVEAKNPELTNLSVNPAVVKVGSSSSFGYTLSEPAEITAQVIKPDGTVIRQFQPVLKTISGTYSIGWDTKDNVGSFIPSGDYVLKITATDNYNKTGTAQIFFQAGAAPIISGAAAAPQPINVGAGETAAISYSINEPSYVTVRIHNSSGSLINTLCYDKEVAPGTDYIVWDGKGSNGTAVNGTYTYRIDATSVIGNFKGTQVSGTIEVTGVL